MSFMDNLAANPSGSGGVYGQVKQAPDLDVLGIVRQLKDREMQDFKEKSNFMADLSMRQQGRMRAMMDPSNGSLNQFNGQPVNQGANGQPMNTVMAQDPNVMSGYQKGELGIRQQGMELEKQRLAQQGKLGQEAVDVRSRQQELNQQKSDQTNTQKQADMERKIKEADAKIELATQALQQKTDSGEATIQLHRDLAAAVEERHKLEMATKESQFQITSKQHQETIDELKKRLDQGSFSQSTTQLNPDGTKKVVTTQRGSANDTVSVMGKDGKQYNIPRSKLNDMDADGTPHWKQPDDQEEE